MSIGCAIPVEKRAELAQNAAKIVASGRGILAADESTGTIGKRFQSINVENTEENRRAYRELLFTAGAELADSIGGVIMFEETLYQKAADGRSFVEILNEAGIIPGIKIDTGLVEIPGTNGETVTQGLDGLEARCAKYYQQGARFTKWRCALRIDPVTGVPSERSIRANAETLARMAIISQRNGLVPIVEPEILMDGSHDLAQAVIAAEHVLAMTYYYLHLHGVFLEGSLLKPSMVCAGADCPVSYTPEEVAAATVTVLQRTVPSSVVGITFLSGGQSEEDATLHLNAINRFDAESNRKPWKLTFSYGRALQATVLKTWKGQAENVPAAKAALLQRAKANSQASIGKYTGGAASAAASETLYVRNYVY
ncbi:fructose-bisphosphate aldolase class-I [Fonticula alba]|uniref:Fructose-bisphosphate aldolase n=1 Tax=Fonticula alba TaxID=691883 RepID=A0A058Z4F5_FONAL|nr:fructose-bisphosphate aldolase class-I [Fonticula alba]KCV69150.1 fructose-bisphosphate aldolase class-I [Fonticula alba]|eukprot:XP_009496721.1 fructose-bisphosphate aldolase class-I [Fonticula alba]